MTRLGYDSNVESAAKKLGIKVENTAQEYLASRYIGNINWEQALKLNQTLGNMTLNLRQFIDFKELLEKGRKTEIGKNSGVYFADGHPVHQNRLSIIYEEICEVRSPWRSEWLDAKFNVEPQTSSSFISYDHRLQSDGTLKPEVNMEKLENHVKDNCWIDESSFNKQGLPTKKSSKQNLYYWGPSNNSVAGFVANSDRAYLYCCRIPSNSYSALGVRATASKKI